MRCRFTVLERRGSLAPGPTSVGAQLATIRTIRTMWRLARANCARLADWPQRRAT